MNNEKVIEGDKLISEFMGFKLKPHAIKSYAKDGIKQWRTADTKSPLWGVLEGNYEIEVHFHSSWDWLMPAWAKLGKEIFEMRGSFNKEDYFTAARLTREMIDTLQKPDIECAFSVLVEFITWYNQNKPK